MVPQLVGSSLGCLTLGVIAALLAAATATVLRAQPARRRWTLGLLVALPFLTPALVTGYLYSSSSLALVRAPRLRVVLYGLLLLYRVTSAAVVVTLFAPPRSSDTSVFCHALLPCCRGRAWRSPAFRMRVYAPTWTLAAGVAFLLAFSEMELASLLYVNTFSVALFDAQVGGLVLRSSLARLAPGLILQVLVLGAVLQAATRVRPRFGGAFSGPRRQGGRGMALSIWGWHAVAVFVSALLPCVFLFLRAAASLREQALRRGLWEDVAVSAGCAAVTALALLFLARRLCETLSMDRGFRSWGWALMACLPGLCGGLVLALAGVAVFSSPGPVAVRDTPLPVVLVHVILYLPVALAAQAALGRSRRAVELHAARLARGLIPGAERARRAARLMRALASRGETWVFLLLFHLSYLELTAAAILSAPGLTPVSVRLYNLMHYGRMPALSAMLALSTLVPAAALGFAFVRARVAERGGSCA